MIYSSVQSAVVSALAAECIDNTAKQEWQRLIDVAIQGGGSVGQVDRMHADCWVYARLHSQLSPRLWHVLVARYSTHKARKVAAIAALFPVVEVKAPPLFRQKAITAWAIPPLKGKVARTGMELASRAARRDAEFVAGVETTRSRLRADAKNERAARLVAASGIKAAPRRYVGEVIMAKREDYVQRSSDMIVLDAAFYDMNSWDPDASPERTRRYWRQQINKALEGMVSEAFAEAQEILAAEGVLIAANDA